jgi:hypothetical protein
MPQYKIIYFNVKALAEPMRFLLAYGNIDFEDVRIEKENWPAIKDSEFLVGFSWKLWGFVGSNCRGIFLVDHKREEMFDGLMQIEEKLQDIRGNNWYDSS